MPSAEGNLLSRVVRHPSDLVQVLEANISHRHFHDVEYGRVWEWVIEFWERHAKCPDRDTLRMQYPSFSLERTPEPIDFYISEILSAHKRAGTTEMIIEATNMMAEGYVDDALATLSEGAMDIAQAVTVTRDEEVNAPWRERVNNYKTIEESSGELVGIPSGFPTIDAATGGFSAEQFVVLIAPAKAGKSTTLLKMAISANDAGYSVMFITFEMSNAEQMARYDAMRAGINYNKILRGQMDEDDWGRLRRGMAKAEENPSMHFVHDVHTTTTLSALAAKVQQYKPQLLIVDGVYMMDSEVYGSEASDTKSLTKLSRGLKRLAQTQKIPVIASTQALDHKWSKKTGITSSAAGYTSAFQQDADLMLGLEPTEQDSHIAKLRITDGRNAAKRLVYLVFDWSEGKLEEHAMDDDDEDEDY